MPRAKKPTSEPTAAQIRKANLDAIREAYGEADDIASQLFAKAVDLDDQKRELFGIIAANRTSLRALATQGLVSVQDVDALYPPRASGEEETPAEDAQSGE